MNLLKKQFYITYHILSIFFLERFPDEEHYDCNDYSVSKCKNDHPEERLPVTFI